MDQPRLYVDLNEMITDDIALLSKEDSKTDSAGNLVSFYDQMPVLIYSDDASDTGEPDNLLANGVAIKYDLSKYSWCKHVKWCVRIDWNSLIHESDQKFLTTLPQEIKKHPDDLRALRDCLITFQKNGMNRDAMMKNLEKLRKESDPATENVLLDLMDFVSGWCSPGLSVF